MSIWLAGADMQTYPDLRRAVAMYYAAILVGAIAMHAIVRTYYMGHKREIATQASMMQPALVCGAVRYKVPHVTEQPSTPSTVLYVAYSRVQTGH